MIEFTTPICEYGKAFCMTTFASGMTIPVANAR